MSNHHDSECEDTSGEGVCMCRERQVFARLLLESIGMPKPKPRDHRLSEVMDLPWTPFVEGTMPSHSGGRSIAFVNSRYQVFLSKQSTKHGDCTRILLDLLREAGFDFSVRPKADD